MTATATKRDKQREAKHKGWMVAMCFHCKQRIKPFTRGIRPVMSADPKPRRMGWAHPGCSPKIEVEEAA